MVATVDSQYGTNIYFCCNVFLLNLEQMIIRHLDILLDRWFGGFVWSNVIFTQIQSSIHCITCAWSAKIEKHLIIFVICGCDLVNLNDLLLEHVMTKKHMIDVKSVLCKDINWLRFLVVDYPQLIKCRTECYINSFIPDS